MKADNDACVSIEEAAEDISIEDLKGMLLLSPVAVVNEENKPMFEGSVLSKYLI